MKAGRSVRSIIWALAVIGTGLAYAVTYGDDRKAQEVPHGRISDFKWVSLPEFGGHEAIIYRSPDGSRVAAAFKESGSFTFVYTFDEFMVVTSGKAKISIHGGPAFEVVKGEVAYFREGMTVDFTMSDGFSDVTYLVSNHEVKWR